MSDTSVVRLGNLNDLECINIGIILSGIKLCFADQDNGIDSVAHIFTDFFKDKCLSGLKIHKEFKLEIFVHTDSENNLAEVCKKYHYVFYYVTSSYLPKITFSTFSSIEPLQKLFVIFDYAPSGSQISREISSQILGENDNDNIIVCTMNIELFNTLNKLKSNPELNDLSYNHIKNLHYVLFGSPSDSVKSNQSDPKKELRRYLKNVDIDEQIEQTGLSGFLNTIDFYFKLHTQKKIVYQNYLTKWKEIKITSDLTTIEFVCDLIKKTYDITYLRQEMYDELVDYTDNIFLEKIKDFCQSYSHKLIFLSDNSIEKKSQQITQKLSSTLSAPTSSSIFIDVLDAHTYHRYLMRFQEIATDFNMPSVRAYLDGEIDKVNKKIVQYHTKEIEKNTDLNNITSFLEIIASKDRSNLLTLFQKITSSSRLIVDNLTNNEGWCKFVDKCVKVDLPREQILQLVTEIVMTKIDYYGGDIYNKFGSGQNVSLIYPNCLHAFLLKNLNKHFVFTKLLMYLQHVNRYSGKNVIEYIRKLTLEEYNTLLILEQKLLTLSTIFEDELSQRVEIDDVHVIESFGDKSKKRF